MSLTEFVLHRIVENQAKMVTHELTDTQEEFEFIESLIDGTKPPLNREGWHHLIATPFRYELPVKPEYQARFKPPFSNFLVFYGSCELRTAAYEYGLHWLRERIHLNGLSQVPASRTYFTVGFRDSQILDITSHVKIKKIMDRTSYAASHEYITTVPNPSSIRYPSARDLMGGFCVAAFKKEVLEKRARTSQELRIRYLESEKAAEFEDPSGIHEALTVRWDEVA